MKIEAGKYYRTRGGAVVGPIRRAQGGFWYSCFHTWDGDGGMFLNGAEHDLDLISEVYVSDTPPVNREITEEQFWKNVGDQQRKEAFILGSSETKTLRDEFAMAALTGFCSQQVCFEPNVFAKFSYDCADAMMEARKK
jgi:hypothetical protein